VRGAQAHKQSAVTASATLDRKEIANRKRNEREGKNVVKKRTDSEFDVLTGDLLITKLRQVYRDSDDPHRVPVTSTVAGVELGGGGNENTPAALARTLRNYVFAGVSMSRVVERPENASSMPPQSDFPTQIAGVTTLPIYKQDAPFGALVRAVPNPNPIASHGYLGTNHRHLVLDIESGSTSFGERLQAECYERFHNPENYAANKGLDPCSEAMDQCLDKMTDFLMMGIVAFDIAEDIRNDVPMAEREFKDARQTVAMMRDPEFRRNFMCAMFAGFGAGRTVNMPQEPQYLADPNNLVFDDNDGGIGEIHTKQITSSSAFFSALMDLLRMDNRWLVGKVIRGGKAPGECDAMLM